MIQRAFLFASLLGSLAVALRSVSGYEANGVFRELYPSSELIPHPLGMRALEDKPYP